MSYSETKNSPKDNCCKEYVANVPRNLWELLTPVTPDQLVEFCSSIHKLRIREVERNYVMYLQRLYHIPIRPNESVKATMIRAQLKILKQRLKHFIPIRGASITSNFPTDPLE